MVFDELAIKVTPRLRAFLRAELAQVVHFIALDGEVWNPHKIANAINENPDIPGRISDDTIVRFLAEPSRHQTRRAALESIAGFLMAFEFISERDLRHYGDSSYDRAASALAELYQSGIDPARNRALLGVLRAYRLMGRDRVAEWALTLASPDAGHSLSADLSVSVFSLDDPGHFLAESDYLNPLRYNRVRDHFTDFEPEVEATAPGIAALTASHGFIVIGGDEAALQSVLTVEELHFREDEMVAARVTLSTSYSVFKDGAPVPGDAPLAELEKARRHTLRLVLYPQGKHVEYLPEFDAPSGDSSNGEKKGRGLSFQGAIEGKMSEKDKAYLEAEENEMEVEAALAACADDTARLALAIDLMRADHAVAAIQAGADVDAMHEKRGIPMAHAAASLGMAQVVDAMLARDVDLTIRDRFGRLPSACTGETERTVALRDKLAARQAEQMRARNIPAGRPAPPETS